MDKNVPIGEWKYLTGYVKCNELISVVKTSKDDVNRRAGKWKEFSKQVNTVIAKWLYSQGLYKEYERMERDREFRKKLRSIERELNNLLKNFPDILDNIISGITPIKPKSRPTSPSERETVVENLPVPDSEGSEERSMEPGGELGRGTHGGPGESNEPSVPHPGEDEEIKAPKDIGEGTPTTHKKVRRSGSVIGIAWQPLDSKESIEWIPSENLFIINQNHPAAILAAVDISSKMFYTVHEVLRYIAENFVETKTDDEKINKFWELYESYLQILEGD